MSPVKPHKILVVDDEPDVEPLIRQRMRRDVRSGRYEFVFAHNGVEALAMLQEQSDIEMVLSDINMPKMDGLTLLAQIPKVDPNLRCVIVSAYGDMKLDNGLLGVAIADVSDKGVPASLFMMSSRTLLKGAAVGLSDPGAVLQEVNNLLNDDNQGLMFVTMLYATFEPASGAFTYANGGHNSPLLVRAGGSSELLPLTGGVALGVVPDYPYAQSSMTLGLGEKLVLYTDGVTEAMNSAKEEFGVERLCAIFAGGAPEASKATSQAVFDAVHAFAGDTPQSDAGGYGWRSTGAPCSRCRSGSTRATPRP